MGVMVVMDGRDGWSWWMGVMVVMEGCDGWS